MQKSTKKLFKADLRNLRIIATEQALYQLFKEQNADFYYNTKDGRTKNSKKYKALEKFYHANKTKIAFHLHQRARNIYSAWKYIGINCVEAGKIYDAILKEKYSQVEKVYNLELQGHELDWDQLEIPTPRSKYIRKIRPWDFYSNGLVIKAA